MGCLVADTIIKVKPIGNSPDAALNFPASYPAHLASLASPTSSEACSFDYIALITRCVVDSKSRQKPAYFMILKLLSLPGNNHKSRGASRCAYVWPNSSP
jgi:hypothetical protein